jgi:hypothetical protein
MEYAESQSYLRHLSLISCIYSEACVFGGSECSDHSTTKGLDHIFTNIEQNYHQLKLMRPMKSAA